MDRIDLKPHLVNKGCIQLCSIGHEIFQLFPQKPKPKAEKFHTFQRAKMIFTKRKMSIFSTQNSIVANSNFLAEFYSSHFDLKCHTQKHNGAGWIFVHRPPCLMIGHENFPIFLTFQTFSEALEREI